MTLRRDELIKLWRSVAPEAEVAERLDVVARSSRHPMAFLREAGIDYRAPGDATNTGLEDGSVDAHFSYNVFEHVPAEAIEKILAEARRILKPGGVCVHYVDPSDHYAQLRPRHHPHQFPALRRRGVGAARGESLRLSQSPPRR